MAAGLLKAGGKPAPAHVLGQNALLRWGGKTLLRLQLFQQPDGGDVIVITLCRRPDADAVLDDPVVVPVRVLHLRVQDRGGQFPGGNTLGRGRKRLRRFFFGWCLGLGICGRIDRQRVSLLKGKHILPGLLRQFHRQLCLPEHLVQAVVCL